MMPSRDVKSSSSNSWFGGERVCLTTELPAITRHSEFVTVEIEGLYGVLLLSDRIRQNEGRHNAESQFLKYEMVLCATLRIYSLLA